MFTLGFEKSAMASTKFNARRIVTEADRNRVNNLTARKEVEAWHLLEGTTDKPAWKLRAADMAQNKLRSIRKLTRAERRARLRGKSPEYKKWFMGIIRTLRSKS